MTAAPSLLLMACRHECPWFVPIEDEAQQLHTTAETFKVQIAQHYPEKERDGPSTYVCYRSVGVYLNPLETPHPKTEFAGKRKK